VVNGQDDNYGIVAPFKIRYLQYENPDDENKATRYGISSELYAAVSSAFLGGNTDENKLTDVIFFAKHQDRDIKDKLKPHEKALIQEWLNLRKNVVRPIMADLKKEISTQSASSGSPQSPLDGPEPIKCPPNSPVDFAPEPSGTVYWPVISNDKDWDVVSYRFGPNKGDIVRGINTNREFDADRPGDRVHGAIDIYANVGDPVISCQDGRFIYAIEGFYPAGGKDTSAILIEHPIENPKVIALYGEVKYKTWEKYNLKLGQTVRAGQVIGEIGRSPGGSHMLHFETWDINLKKVKYPLYKDTRRWLKNGSPPKTLLNPTKYLLYIKKYGIKLRPGDPLPSVNPTTYESLPFSESLSSNESIFSKLGEYATSAQLYAAVSSAFLGGNTDENKLTDMIFFARHPERNGEKLKTYEKALIQEWLNLRNNVVRPIIAKMKEVKGSTGASTPATPAGSGSVVLPLILSGPMVRRATVDSVWFWIVLKEKISDIYGTIVQYNNQGQKIKEISVQTSEFRTVQLGKNIWVALCKVIATGTWFPTDTILGYDLKMVTEGSVSSNTWLLSELNLNGNLGLNYPPFDLPTFVIGRRNTNIIQGSCRRPGSGKEDYRDAMEDAFKVLDDWMAENATEPYQRPASNIQTGDQIYADDLPGTLFDAIENLSLDVFGYSEKINLSRAMGNNQLVPSNEISSIPKGNQEMSQRQLMTHYSKSLIGFSTDDGERHLLSFPEYAAMYLLVWCPEIWRDYYKGGNSPPTLSDYEKSVRACRRVMANCATYFVFDDHDVTDDWNLDKLWRDTTKGNPTGRQIISNALLAYLFFQGWGNDPDMFDKDFIQSASNHLDNLQRNNGDPTIGWGNESPIYETILSMHWSYMAASNPKALCVDTRTLREFPVPLPNPDTTHRDYDEEYVRLGLNFYKFWKYSLSRPAEEKSAILLGRKVRDKLEVLLRKENFKPDDVLLIVLPTPLIGHPFHIYAQEIVYPYPSARYPGDWELFDNNTSQRARFIYWLEETFKPSALVVFSGDVHYSSVIYSGYVCAKSAMDAIAGNYRWKLPVIQITSSPIKNIKPILVKAVSSPYVGKGIIAEGLAPEARARFNIDETGFFIGAGFNTADLSGDLGKDTLIHRNNFCIVTMPIEPEFKVKSRFIGPKDGKRAESVTSIYIKDDKFMKPITQMVMDDPFKNKLKLVTTAIKLGSLIL
jgi:murein DD-endopeptidase MepM/ murein hydrolase activator NlpD